MGTEVTNDNADRSAVLSMMLGRQDRRTTKESLKYGQSLRKAVPRDVLAAWVASPSRPDSASLIFGQDATRVPALVPIRHERMSVSAFTFYRGAALIMASDLSTLPTTGIEVQLCGDAHISNFGLFASPERKVVFDINDFDETCRGPWEWDVARLVASVEICGIDRQFSKKERAEAVLAAARGYREGMRRFAKMGNLEVWYKQADVNELLSTFGDRLKKTDRKRVDKKLAKSQEKNSVRAVRKFTEVVDGHLRVKNDPPLVVPLRNIMEQTHGPTPGDLDMAKLISMILAQYRHSLPPERAYLVDQYVGVDIAHKIVGVGSVGNQAWIVVLEGASKNDPLVLQIKEATESVLERFVGKAQQPNHGQRVVEGQHAMQTASDMLLGWTSLPMPNGRTRDFYVRQLWDGKGSIDLQTIPPNRLSKLAAGCGVTLAHAHARTGDRHAIAAYLGKSDVFDNAALEFARTYAKQNERDYARFLEALNEQATKRAGSSRV